MIGRVPTVGSMMGTILSLVSEREPYADIPVCITLHFIRNGGGGDLSCRHELAGGIAPSNRTEYRVKTSFRALPFAFGSYALTVASKIMHAMKHKGIRTRWSLKYSTLFCM